jgi:hypothetical protein
MDYSFKNLLSSSKFEPAYFGTFLSAKLVYVPAKIGEELLVNGEGTGVIIKFKGYSFGIKKYAIYYQGNRVRGLYSHPSYEPLREEAKRYHEKFLAFGRPNVK